MRVLMTAPYIGEFGWELLSWQGRVRQRFYAGGFDRLVVMGTPGKSAFYEDMPTEYVEVDLSAVPGSPCEDRRAAGPKSDPLPADQLREKVRPIVDDMAQRLRERGDEIETFWPEYDGTIHPYHEPHQRFVRFRLPATEVLPAPWVVMVQRTRAFGPNNWPTDFWSELADRLECRGIHTSIYPCEARGAIAAAANCDLAVGQSTGGMHLASLCGCPHVAWSVNGDHPKSQLQMTDRQRYQTFWNPLATPVLFHPVEDHPTPAEVESWVVAGLDRIGRRTGSRVRQFRFRRQWHVRDWIIRHVVERPAFRQWPWPIQRFVRWELV